MKTNWQNWVFPTVALVAFWVWTSQGNCGPTWIDEQTPTIWTVDDSRPLESKTVIDLVTCDQVYVIGKGWQESGNTYYRILRRVAVKVGGLKKTGYYWSVETRHLHELEPIPSI